MREITLKDYITEGKGSRTYSDVATLIGRTTGRAWQLRDREDIRLVFDDDGSFVRSYKITILKEAATE